MIKNLFGRLFSTRSAVATAPSFDELTSAMRAEISLSIRSDSFNESNRTLEAVASTDNPVPMFDMEYWEVVDEILVADGGSFPTEIPMLDSHDRTSVSKVLGNGTNARQVDGQEHSQWQILLTFDTDQPSEDAMRKASKRFIRDVSIGYTVESCVYISPGQTETINGRSYTAGARRLKVCTRWRANEISLTPIGADKDAKIRAMIAIKGRNPMDQRQACGVRGDNLAAELNEIIDMMAGDDMPRGDIVNDMGSAAGIESGTVNQILNGSIGCPSIERLEGFSAVLAVPLDRLVSAAEEDGCSYED